MSPTKWKIIQTYNKKYNVKWKGWLFWHWGFCGAWSDLPRDFNSIEEAEKAILESEQRAQGVGTIVKEFTTP